MRPHVKLGRHERARRHDAAPLAARQETGTRCVVSSTIRITPGTNRIARAARSAPGQYKLIRRYDDNSVELFDLVDRLGETRNLASRSRKLAATLDEQLGRWLKETASTDAHAAQVNGR